MIASFRPSPRQMQVLRLLAAGHSNQAIAAELGIAKSTVQTHITEMRVRLDAVDRADLIVQARRYGLLNADGAL